MTKRILLDLKLPKVNGFEVLERIRTDEHTRHPSVIIFTSSNAEDGLINSFGLGANSNYQKLLTSSIIWWPANKRDFDGSLYI